jgi:hypothetical protein
MTNEICLNEVFMVGRITQGPIRTADQMVHFMVGGEAEEPPFHCEAEEPPFHCMCEGRTAANFEEHCSVGDEISIEGELRWVNFPNTGKTLIVYARYVSYGRKPSSLKA